jgi:ADP-heptose:LPS heptosyltransferase
MTFTHKYKVWERNPGGKKRCLIVRYGAIGDQMMASSIFPLLKEQGFFLTVNCTPESKEVLKHDPYVDEWLIQAKDYVPNQLLGPYWEYLGERYDRVINLCESIEGGLLTMRGRLTHDYPDDVRRRLYGDVSYLGRTHDIAGVPHTYNPQFFMSEFEVKWAKALQRAWTNHEVPIVLWAIAGSAHHKIYPWVAPVIKWLLERTPVHIVITGDKDTGVKLQDAILTPSHWEGFDLSRVHPMAGKWTIRETLSFANNSDVVIGPETGVLNSVSFNPSVKKVMYLSHSSKANIGGDWLNSSVLCPPVKLSPCYPCHRLHGDNFDYCFQSKDTNAALCATSIRPEDVFGAIMESMGATKAA